jgi:hypothetical protein
MLLFMQASYEPLAPLGETDVEEYLNYHHQVIINAAIDDAKVNRNCINYFSIIYLLCSAIVIVGVVTVLYIALLSLRVTGCKQ